MRDDDRVRHLELIQQVVSRMADHSFVLKGWSVTVAAVLRDHPDQLGELAAGNEAHLAAHQWRQVYPPHR